MAAASCSILPTCQRFGGTYYFHHQAGVQLGREQYVPPKHLHTAKMLHGSTIPKATLTLPMPWTPQIPHHSTHNYIQSYVFTRHGHKRVSVEFCMLRGIKATLSLATGWTTAIRFPTAAAAILFATMSGQVLWTSRPPTQSVPGTSDTAARQ